MQGLTNPLPGRPEQASNGAGQVQFPARHPAGQVNENFKQLKFGEIYSKRALKDSCADICVCNNHGFLTFSSQFAYCNLPVNLATFVY